MENRIKESRKKAGFTQPQLAKLLGVSHRTLTSYEKDASKITVKMTQKIATECGVDEIWLLTGQGSMEKSVLEPDSETVKKVVIEHQDIIKQFKDPERGLRINQRIINVQNTSERLFEKIETYIEGVEDAAKELKEEAKKTNQQIPSTKWQANGK